MRKADLGQRQTVFYFYAFLIYNYIYGECKGGTKSEEVSAEKEV